MSPLIPNQPFSEANYEALDDFLMSDDSPEESMMLPDLHGFLTAVITGPLIMPSEWLPVVWGCDESAFKTIAQARKIMTLMLRLNNGIAAFLLEDPDKLRAVLHGEPRRRAVCNDRRRLALWLLARS